MRSLPRSDNTRGVDHAHESHDPHGAPFDDTKASQLMKDVMLGMLVRVDLLIAPEHGRGDLKR